MRAPRKPRLAAAAEKQAAANKATRRRVAKALGVPERLLTPKQASKPFTSAEEAGDRLTKKSQRLQLELKKLKSVEIDLLDQLDLSRAAYAGAKTKQDLLTIENTGLLSDVARLKKADHENNFELCQLRTANETAAATIETLQRNLRARDLTIMAYRGRIQELSGELEKTKSRLDRTQTAFNGLAERVGVLELRRALRQDARAAERGRAEAGVPGQFSGLDA